MRPLHLVQRGKQCALRFGHLTVAEKIAMIERRVTQCRVDERQDLVLGRPARGHSRADEERLCAGAPVERCGENVRVVRDQYWEARDLAERLTEVPLPQRQRVDLALLAAQS